MDSDQGPWPVLAGQATADGASLNILAGSMGPNRRADWTSCTALINTEAHSMRSDINGQPMVQ